jgi:hypothetical protein
LKSHCQATKAFAAISRGFLLPLAKLASTFSPPVRRLGGENPILRALHGRAYSIHGQKFLSNTEEER